MISPLNPSSKKAPLFTKEEADFFKGIPLSKGTLFGVVYNAIKRQKPDEAIKILNAIYKMEELKLNTIHNTPQSCFFKPDQEERKQEQKLELIKNFAQRVLNTNINEDIKTYNKCALLSFSIIKKILDTPQCFEEKGALREAANKSSINIVDQFLDESWNTHGDKSVTLDLFNQLLETEIKNNPLDLLAILKHLVTKSIESVQAEPQIDITKLSPEACLKMMERQKNLPKQRPEESSNRRVQVLDQHLTKTGLPKILAKIVLSKNCGLKSLLEGVKGSFRALHHLPQVFASTEELINNPKLIMTQHEIVTDEEESKATTPPQITPFQRTQSFWEEQSRSKRSLRFLK